MPKHYIDIRFHLEEEVEEFEPDDTYTHYHIEGVERIKTKGISEDRIEDLAETVAQSDHYQIYLHGSIVRALSDTGVIDV